MKFLLILSLLVVGCNKQPSAPKPKPVATTDAGAPEGGVLGLSDDDIEIINAWNYLIMQSD